MTQAAKLVPGRPHVSTLWRWCRKGIKSRTGERIHLEHHRAGRHLYTTKAALDEFFAQTSEADLKYFDKPTQKLPKLPRTRTEAQRAHAVREAEERLRAQGL